MHACTHVVLLFRHLYIHFIRKLAIFLSKSVSLGRISVQYIYCWDKNEKQIHYDMISSQGSLDNFGSKGFDFVESLWWLANEDEWRVSWGISMVLLLDGNLELGAYVRSNLFFRSVYGICLDRAVKKNSWIRPIFFSSVRSTFWVTI